MLYLSDTDIVIFIWLPLVTPMFTHNFIIILAAKKNLLCMNITFSIWSFKKGTQINLTTMVHLTSVRKCMIHSSIIRSPYFGQLINLRTFSCFLAHGEYELFLAF